MRVYKVILKYGYSKPRYLVVDCISDIEPLLKKAQIESDIIEVELISDSVINMWAQ